MKKILIKLTKEQREAIKPLMESVGEADLKGKKGAILIQPGEFFATCIFVPHELAVQIWEILKEIK